MQIVDSVKDFIRYASLRAKIIAVSIIASVCLILVISIGVLISRIKPAVPDYNPVEITNYEEATNAPSIQRTMISQHLYDLILEAEGTSNLDLTSAKIREGSYRETKEDNVTRARYIIDIEPLHYSFEINTSWTGGRADSEDPDVSISCPHYIDVIYKDKKCIAETPEQQISRYLPYNEYMSNGEKFHVESRVYDNFQEHAGEQYLAVIVPRCRDEAAKAEALTIFKKWLKSIYLDPNDYHIEAMGKCL